MFLSAAARHPAFAYFKPLPSLLLLAVMVMALATHRAGAADFTLEQVRSYAFPQDLVAARTSDHVAWIADSNSTLRSLSVNCSSTFRPSGEWLAGGVPACRWPAYIHRDSPSSARLNHRWRCRNRFRGLAAGVAMHHFYWGQ
jgi:hypothetical protein